MSRYFGAAPSDEELMAMIDVQERVELSPEQFDAVLYDKMESQNAAQRKKAAATSLIRQINGKPPVPPPPPSPKASSDKTGLLIGIGVALVAILYFMRRKKGPSQVTYAGSPKGMR